MLRKFIQSFFICCNLFKILDTQMYSKKRGGRREGVRKGEAKERVNSRGRAQRLKDAIKHFYGEKIIKDPVKG